MGRRLREGADPFGLRVVDPACGSGSFLIAAFDALDSWLAQHRPDVPALERRRRILTECLYGVDLDDQAVEITRLNLVLRASLERAKLPMLHHIQQGDSLVDDAAVAAAPFVWKNRFAAVMEQGGFDVVLGNPPYVRAELQSAAFKAYAAQHYTAAAGGADLYVYFMESGLRLLRPSGVYGVIVANKWLRAGYGEKIRAVLRPHLREVVDFGELKVFSDAATNPAIVLADKEPVASAVCMTRVKTLEFTTLADYVDENRYCVPRDSLTGASWSLAPEERAERLAQMRAVGVPLAEYISPLKIRSGVKTGYNEAFVISTAKRNEIIHRDPTSGGFIKPFVVGDNVRNYQINFENRYLIFMGRGNNIEDYPGIYEYLLPYRERLEPRPVDYIGVWPGRKHGSYKWFELQDPVSYHKEFDRPKIVYPDIAKEPRAAFDELSAYIDMTAFFISTEDLFLLGLLNSAPIWEYLKDTCAVLGDAEKGGRLRLKRQYIQTLPIPPAAPDDPRRARIVELVSDMLRLKRQAADPLAAMRDSDLPAQMAEIEAAINRQVAELYGL